MAAIPETLERVIETVGLAPARALSQRYGKTHVYLPARMPADHTLARLIGFEAARALVRAFGRGHLYVPAWPAAAGERARQVHELTEAGFSAPAIARRLRISERSVHRWRARTRA